MDKLWKAPKKRWFSPFIVLGNNTFARRWFQIFFNFHPYLGKWSNLTHIFQVGWFNHQLVWGDQCKTGPWIFAATTRCMIDLHFAGEQVWEESRHHITWKKLDVNVASLYPHIALRQNEVLTLSLQSIAFWNMWTLLAVSVRQVPKWPLRELYNSTYIYIIYSRTIGYMIYNIFLYTSGETLSSGMDWLAEVAGRTCLAFFQVPWQTGQSEIRPKITFSRLTTWDGIRIMWNVVFMDFACFCFRNGMVVVYSGFALSITSIRLRIGGACSKDSLTNKKTMNMVLFTYRNVCVYTLAWIAFV